MGLLLATGCAGGDLVNPPSRPRLVVRGLTAGDTLDYAGATRTLTAYFAGTGGERPASAAWFSRDTLVALVTPAGVVTAQGDGVTWIVAIGTDNASDSIRAVVRRRAAQVEVTPGAAARPEGRTQQFAAAVRDAGGAPLGAAVALTWRSSRPDVAAVDGTGLVFARAPGQAVIEATAGTGPGAPVGRATVSVGAPLALRIEPAQVDVGVGQLSSAVLAPGPILTADATDPEEDVTVRFSTADGALVATPAAVALRANGRPQTNSPLVVVGRAPGVARVIASAAGFAPAEFSVHVTRPRLRLDRPDSADVVAYPDSVVRVRLATTTDVLRTVRRVAERLPLTVTSSDTAVLAPLPAAAEGGLAVAAGEAFTDLRAAPRGAGSAWLRVAAPGYAPESVQVRVTAAPRLRFVDFVYRDVVHAIVGAGQASGLDDGVRIAGVGGSPPYPVVTLTQRRPDLVRVPTAVGVNLTFGGYTPQYAGLALGVDTVVASAPGYRPDTLVVHVSTPRVLVRQVDRSRVLPDSARVTAGMTLAVFVGDSLGRAGFPINGPVALAAASSGASVLRVEQPVVVGTSTSGGALILRPLDVGSASLTLSDPAGRIPPLTLPPIRVVTTPMIVGAGDTPNAVVRVGMEQRLGDASALIFGIPDRGSWYDTDLQARATDARLLPRVTVLPPAPYAYGRRTVDVAAGDMEGTAWVVLSAPGLRTDSVRVEVGRPRLGVVVDEPEPFFRPRAFGDTIGVAIRVYDQTGRRRTSDQVLPLELESSDASVVRVLTPAPAVAAGAYETRAQVVLMAPGTAVLRARDPRAGGARYDDAPGVAVTVPPPGP